MPKYHVLRLARPIPVLQDDAPKTIFVRETTAHACCHYGIPVIVDNHGNLWDEFMLVSYDDTGKIKNLPED